jgi:squalene-hopene/tetraprenyl-beta-curcumene cyclase
MLQKLKTLKYRRAIFALVLIANVALPASAWSASDPNCDSLFLRAGRFVRSLFSGSNSSRSATESVAQRVTPVSPVSRDLPAAQSVAPSAPQSVPQNISARVTQAPAETQAPRESGPTQTESVRQESRPVVEAAPVVAPQFQAQLADAFIERRATAWVSQKNCISCHTVLPYSLSHFDAASIENEGMKQIRTYMNNRIDNWTSVQTWYPSKESESKATELILSTYFFSQSDLVAQATSDRTVKAARLLVTYQRADGGFPWLNYGLQPFESQGAEPFGGALAALSFSSIRGPQQAEFEPQMAKLKTFLQGKFASAGNNDVDRLTVAWGNTGLKGTIQDSDVRTTIQKALAKQQSDGGWSINTLTGGTWTKKGSSVMAQANSSDTYATSFVLYVMKETGLSADPAFEQAYARGVEWLKAGQLPSGGWEGVSLNTSSSYNTQLASDIASGFAYAVLKN